MLFILGLCLGFVGGVMLMLEIQIKHTYLHYGHKG